MTEPEPLPVVNEDLDRGSSPIAEHEHRTRKRIGIEHLAATLGQAIDAGAEISVMAVGGRLRFRQNTWRYPKTFACFACRRIRRN